MLLKTWPDPVFVRDVAKFIGFAQLYSRFIPNFDMRAAPLRIVTKQEYTNPIAKHFFIHEPTVTEKLLQLLCLSMRQAGQIQSVLSTNRAHSRIYHLLLNSATSQENNVMVINNPPTQHDIAARVNVSRETVSRALQVLLKQGIVQKDIKRLIVRNPEKLEQLAKGRAA
jgi:CRP-like cAMP-binding protein